MKQRIFYLDFIRALSTVCIVIFHFNITQETMHIGRGTLISNNYANVTLGQIGVVLFFIISGASLAYTYQEKLDIKKFFKKRFIALYPMFWIAYSIAFLYLFYKNKTINHSVPKSTFILTFLGLDGYFYSSIKNFYIIGEWFLGCIIIIYLFFPLLHRLISKKPKIFLSFILFFYIVLVQKYNLKMSIECNFIIRIFDFIIGMYLIKYIKSIKLYQFILALIISLSLLCIPVNFVNKMYKITVIGICLFLVFIYISKYINTKKIKLIFEYISKYSYSIFLVHHIVIGEILARFNNTSISKTETLCLFMIVSIVIGMISIFLYKVSGKITQYVF